MAESARERSSAGIASAETGLQLVCLLGVL